MACGAECSKRSRLHEGPCTERWAAYMRPRPEHSRLETDKAREQYAQGDRVANADDEERRFPRRFVQPREDASR